MRRVHSAAQARMRAQPTYAVVNTLPPARVCSWNVLLLTTPHDWDLSIEWPQEHYLIGMSYLTELEPQRLVWIRAGGLQGRANVMSVSVGLLALRTERRTIRVRLVGHGPLSPIWRRG